MYLTHASFDQPTQNLAFDEALLEQAESTTEHPEVLRIWEPKNSFVVLGRSSSARREVNLEYCRQHALPIMRRCSGGATIVTGPGCLMYAVLLDYRRRENLRMLEQAHRFVMGQLQAAIGRLKIDVKMQGTSDLTLDGRKFSGNSLRCKRNWMIYHGTLLCDFDLTRVTQCLGDPQRQPDYRGGRSHQDFLTSLPVAIPELRSAIAQQWQAQKVFDDTPDRLTQQLAAEKYSSDEWTFKVS